MKACMRCLTLFSDEGRYSLQKSFFPDVYKCPIHNCYGHVFDIDDDLVHPITKFWEKKIYTRYSCASHLHNNYYCGPYVQFGDFHTNVKRLHLLQEKAIETLKKDKVEHCIEIEISHKELSIQDSLYNRDPNSTHSKGVETLYIGNRSSFKGNYLKRIEIKYNFIRFLYSVLENI